MTQLDHTSAAGRMARLVEAVSEDQLDGPTPCTDWRVRDLVDHVHEFSLVFTLNATKTPIPERDFVHDGRLPTDWRSRVVQQLDDLARAWHDEAAWSGRVSAGGIEMSADDNALVAMEELVVHGWDLARSTGQDIDQVDGDSLAAVDRFLEVFADPIASGKGPYGPAVEVAAGASRLDQMLGRAGRDPAWRPSSL